jgi:membrane protease YdiL (CAAX protease family)
LNPFPENPEAAPVIQSEALPDIAAGSLPEIVPAPLTDPVWNGWDLLKLISVTIVTLALSMIGVLLAARRWAYPHRDVAELARNAVVVVLGQGVGYLLVFLYMYVLVTRERRRPDFLNAIHWNWPSNPSTYLMWGVGLSVALQALAHLLPIPKNLPIDSFFRTPAEAWVLTIFGITLAPMMEEFLFRAFLYPVLKRQLGWGAAILLTALGFALLHGSQLKFAWGPLLVIFLVGLVLTIVRAQKNSVAASLLMHIAYNGTISALMFMATDGFRHLEKLNQ